MATSVMCSRCLKAGSPKPYHFAFEFCERAVVEGTQNLTCGLENDSVAVVSLVPDLVMSNLEKVTLSYWYLFN